MYYYSYDLPSAVTEEGLASAVCARVNESVKDYLSGVTDYVAQCQKTIEEQQEIIDTLEAQNDALRQQVAELKQCLATCHAMSSKQVNFNKVGTVKNIYHYAAGSVHNDSRNIVSICEEDKKKLIN